MEPQALSPGRAVNIVAGVDDERPIRLVLAAGITAVMAEDLAERTRFIWSGYQAASRLDSKLRENLLKRAFREFDELRSDLSEPPAILASGGTATVVAMIRLEAAYGGRRKYRLGDRGSPDAIHISMEKAEGGWKASDIRGSSPLGLGERFLRLLGAERGLALSGRSAGKARSMHAVSPKDGGTIRSRALVAGMRLPGVGGPLRAVAAARVRLS